MPCSYMPKNSQSGSDSNLPKRSWLSPSCSNEKCSNYAVTGLDYPKHGPDRQGRQRYKCKKCGTIFIRPPQPEGLFKISRRIEDQDITSSPPVDEVVTSKPLQSEPIKNTENFTVLFTLTLTAIEGLQKISNSFGMECNEMLEQMGQGKFEVRPLNQEKPDTE